jgi:hypothetical protein
MIYLFQFFTGYPVIPEIDQQKKNDAEKTVEFFGKYYNFLLEIFGNFFCNLTLYLPPILMLTFI